MKIQVLELPSDRLGEFTSTPFVLVFSGADERQCEYLSEEATHDALMDTTSAQGVLIFGDDDIETGGEVSAEIRRQVEAILRR